MSGPAVAAPFGYRSRFAVPVALAVFTVLAGGIATALCLMLAGRDLRAPDRAMLLGLSTGGILLVAATVIGAAYRVINHRVFHHRVVSPPPGRCSYRSIGGHARHCADRKQPRVMAPGHRRWRVMRPAEGAHQSMERATTAAGPSRTASRS